MIFFKTLGWDWDGMESTFCERGRECFFNIHTVFGRDGIISLGMGAGVNIHSVVSLYSTSLMDSSSALLEWPFDG